MTSFHHIMEKEFCKMVVVCGEGVLVIISLQCREDEACEDVGQLAGIWCTV